MDEPAEPAEPAEAALRELQRLIDRSVATASPAVADSIAFPDRQMTASELIEFWQSVSLVAMATVGAEGQPHIAPVHARLEGTTVSLVIYEHTVRRADLASNPRVALTTWGPQGRAVIAYGRAHEVPGSLRDASTGQSGATRRVLEIRVELTRIYAMGPRPSAAA